jgi:hypothetical protein
MFAAFFKKPNSEIDTKIMAECEYALHERMIKMLRNNQSITWASPKMETRSETAVKKMPRFRKAFVLPH